MQETDLYEDVRALLATRDPSAVRLLAARLNAADWADVIPRLNPAEVALLIQWLPDEEIPEILEELEPVEAGAILRTLTRPVAADYLEAMDPDDATDVFETFTAQEAEQFLIAMEPTEAAEIRELLAYPPETAGGIMTPAFVSVSPNLRADQTVVALRKVAEDAETVNYVYVADTEGHLLGVLALHRLVLTPPDTMVRELMATNIIKVRADADQEEAARLLVDHNLLAIPVVDAENHLLGIITQDDVAEILEEEATEDFERIGGSQPLATSYANASVWLLVRRRIGWLLLLFVGQAYTGTVMSAFSDELETVIVLSFFIPLLIGTGGNVGSQTTTMLVRAIAVGEVGLRDIRWVLPKEFIVGAIMGLVMAAVAFGRAVILDVGFDIGLVVSLTICSIVIWAAVVAAVLPLILRRIRIDPAVVSAPLITTIVDGTGLIIYFTIASVLLDL